MLAPGIIECVTRFLRPVPVALTALALLAGCGGNGDEGGETAPEAGGDPGALAATLTDTECTYDGPESVPPGALSIDVENETDAAGRFELLRLTGGAAAEDLVAYVEGERLSIGDGQQPSWPPVIATVVDQVPVRARWNTTLAGDVQAGTYGIVCWVAPPPTALYLAATLDVTG